MVATALHAECLPDSRERRFAEKIMRGQGQAREQVGRLLKRTITR